MRKGALLLLGFVLLIYFIGSISSYQLNRTGTTLNVTAERNFSHISVSDSSLVFYLSFDVKEDSYNKTFDYSSNSYDAILGNTSFDSFPTFNITGGYFGGGYQFDGVDDFANLNDVSNYISMYKNHTISLWFKTNSSKSESPLISSRVSGVSDYMVLNYRSGYFLVLQYNNGTSYYKTKSENLRGNVWHHIVAMRDNNVTRLFVDGIEETGTATTSANGVVDGTFLGATINSGSKPTLAFNGSIDEIMIFNRSLSATEIKQIYNSTYPRFYSNGEMNFSGIDLSGQGDTNISFENCQEYNGSYIQGRLNSGEWKNFSNCQFNDSSFSGSLSNVNFSVRLFSNNYFYSPLLIGPKGNPINISYLANASVLIFPPTNSSPYYDYNDSYYGAGSNPTGNPIGGFANYSRIVNSSEATYYVNTKAELLDALKNVLPGEVIYINDSVTIDLTNTIVTVNTPNITIASGRGNNYSQGALLKKDNKLLSDPFLFKIYVSHVRITGLRFQGGSLTCDEEVYNAAVYQSRSDFDLDSYGAVYRSSIGVYSNESSTEIDNCEFYDWLSSGIYLDNNSINDYVHHNYIHDNCHFGLGYGLEIAYGNNISVFIEANLFNANRHSVASTYDPSSYKASYNVNLGLRVAHDFDRHGDSNGGGNYTVIDHNTLYSTSEECGSPFPLIYIVKPPWTSNGGRIYNNWFQCSEISNSVYTPYLNDSIPAPGADGTNSTVFSNLANITGNQYSLEPVAVANASDYNVAINESITFDASASYSNESSIRYAEWDFVDNNSLQYGTTTTHSFSEAGRYKVKVTVYDEAGLLNWTYLNITVNPANSSKVYLDFWMYEVSYVDSSEYVQKQAIVDGEVVWRENFSDNVSILKHINIEIQDNLTSDNEINVSLGVATLKNYTDTLYPNQHEVEFFELYIDQVSVLSGNNDSAGSWGDFESFDGLDFTAQESWKNESSWAIRINGDYSHKIAPIYRGNYTSGNFVGISHSFLVSRISTATASAEEASALTSDPGSGSFTGTFKPSPESLQNGYSINLGRNQKVEITIGSETKTVTIYSIGEDEVNFSIDGEDYITGESGSVKIDTNNDGYYDLQITNNGVSGSYVNLQFILINEPVPSKKENVIENIPEVLGKINWKIYVLVGMVGVLILVYFLVIRKKKIDSFVSKNI